MSIVEANKTMSVTWKKTSRELFLPVLHKLDDDFKEAVKWCGVVGNVSRTVKNEDFDRFVSYVFDNINHILNGSYDLRTVPAFSGSKPISWVSKICHILNPFAYPFIYDNILRKQLKISSIEEFWEKLVDCRDEKYPLSREDLYERESYAWAYGKK